MEKVISLNVHSAGGFKKKGNTEKTVWNEILFTNDGSGFRWLRCHHTTSCPSLSVSVYFLCLYRICYVKEKLENTPELVPSSASVKLWSLSPSSISQSVSSERSGSAMSK